MTRSELIFFQNNVAYYTCKINYELMYVIVFNIEKQSIRTIYVL